MYLGTRCTRHPDILRRLGIKNIITANEEDYEYKGGEFENRKYNWTANEEQSLKWQPDLEDAARFIEQKIKNGEKVLVHCAKGVSRSASIVIYYLMTRFHMKFDDALAYVKSKRHVVEPNKFFQKELKKII